MIGSEIKRSFHFVLLRVYKFDFVVCASSVRSKRQAVSRVHRMNFNGSIAITIAFPDRFEGEKTAPREKITYANYMYPC